MSCSERTFCLSPPLQVTPGMSQTAGMEAEPPQVGQSLDLALPEVSSEALGVSFVLPSQTRRTWMNPGQDLPPQRWNILKGHSK